MNKETKDFITSHADEDVRTLALKKAPLHVDLNTALHQIKARQLLKKKLPQWTQNPNIIFPPNISLEQASSQSTALYKASLVQGDTMVDLTAGMGIDCYYLSHNFNSTAYVEQQELLCTLAKHNYKALKQEITVYHQTAEQYLSQLAHTDLIYIDPARRDEKGKKTISIADCTPDLMLLQDTLLQKTSQVLIKLSPMLDITLSLQQLNHVKEVHVVSADNECKELLFLLEANYRGEPQIHCVNILNNGQIQLSEPFLKSEEQEILITYATEIGSYLYEPNTSILKAGLYKLTATRYHLHKLHPSSHLYTSNTLIDNFQGRTFKVIKQVPFSKKGIKTLTQELKAANITTRNFPLTVNDLRKQLKLHDGGEHYIFASTLANNERVLILCTKP